MNKYLVSLYSIDMGATLVTFITNVEPPKTDDEDYAIEDYSPEFESVMEQALIDKGYEYYPEDTCPRWERISGLPYYERVP